MSGLVLSDEKRPAAHGTQLSPVATALVVCLRIFPQHLLPTAFMRTELPLIRTVGDVEVLVRERESGSAALLGISTLGTQTHVVLFQIHILSTRHNYILDLSFKNVAYLDW